MSYFSLKIQDHLHKMAWYEELPLGDKLDLLEAICQAAEEVTPYIHKTSTDEQFKLYEAVSKENEQLKLTLCEIKKLVNKYTTYEWPEP